MTWFRSQARLRPRIAVVTSVYSWSNLVGHFIQWYSRPELDLDKIILCVTDKTREAVEAVKNDRCALYVIPDMPPDAINWNVHKDREEITAWEKLGFTGEDYKLVVDLDEFQSYPWNLREIVNEMDARKEWALAGILIDRFARDYSTPPVRPDVPIEQQYPVTRQWPLRDWPEIVDQKTPWGACMMKVVVCRGACELAVGRHHAKNAVIARHAQFGFGVTDLKVNHYRWCEGVTKTLQARTADRRWDDRYRKECADGLTWLLEQQRTYKEKATPPA